MAHISTEELKKLAQISQLLLEEDEIEPLKEHVQAILAYAERVKDIAGKAQEDQHQQVNVFRDDAVIRTDREPILALAPQADENFFIVPSIIESK